MRQLSEYDCPKKALPGHAAADDANSPVREDTARAFLGRDSPGKAPSEHVLLDMLTKVSRILMLHRNCVTSQERMLNALGLLAARLWNDPMYVLMTHSEGDLPMVDSQQWLTTSLAVAVLMTQMLQGRACLRPPGHARAESLAGT